MKVPLPSTPVGGGIGMTQASAVVEAAPAIRPARSEVFPIEPGGEQRAYRSPQARSRAEDARTETFSLTRASLDPCREVHSADSGSRRTAPGNT